MKMKLIQILALASVMGATGIAQNAAQSASGKTQPSASPTPAAQQKPGATATPAHAKPRASVKKAGPKTDAGKAPVHKVTAKNANPGTAAPAAATPVKNAKATVKSGVLPEKTKKGSAPVTAAVKGTTKSGVAPKTVPPAPVAMVKTKTPVKKGVVASAKITPKAATKSHTHAVEKKPTLTAAGPSTAEKKPAPRLIGSAGRRDPFVSPIRSAGSVTPTQNCTSGKRCLAIPELVLQGTVRDISGKMMAVVSTSNRRTYTLRENDQVFNGSVEKITSDSIIFREYVKDALGRESAKEVVKKMGPTS
jgi:Tfp pilus assembly protein PilP